MVGIRRHLAVAGVVLACWLAAVGWVGAEPPADADVLDIKADALAVDGEGNTARFEGNVVLRRDDWVMTCQALDTTVDGEGQVTRAEAQGPVVLTGPSLWVEADGAVWERASDTVVLSGESTVRRGKNRLTAESVTVHLADERVELSGVRGRFSLSESAASDAAESSPDERPPAGAD